MSYYKIVGGNKYDRELLDMAVGFAADGQVSFAEANLLWDEALDGPGVTKCEKETLLHVMKVLKFTDKALSFLQKKVRGVKSGFYYKQIDGVKYAKDLLEMAEMAKKGGSIDRAGAAGIIKSAGDGPGITQCEQRTLEYILKHSKLSDDARSLLCEAVTPKYKGTSYYVQIKNVRYDRALLKQSDKAAADGGINLADAKALWDSSSEGPGVTDCEKRTIAHVLDVHKCTPEAWKYLHKMLASVHVLPEPESKADEPKLEGMLAEARPEGIMAKEELKKRVNQLESVVDSKMFVAKAGPDGWQLGRFSRVSEGKWEEKKGDSSTIEYFECALPSRTSGSTTVRLANSSGTAVIITSDTALVFREGSNPGECYNLGEYIGTWVESTQAVSSAKRQRLSQ